VNAADPCAEPFSIARVSPLMWVVVGTFVLWMITFCCYYRQYSADMKNVKDLERKNEIFVKVNRGEKRFCDFYSSAASNTHREVISLHIG
jgi:hypothetical protein